MSFAKFYVWNLIGTGNPISWTDKLIKNPHVFPMIRIISDGLFTNAPPLDFSTSQSGPLPDFGTTYSNPGSPNNNFNFNPTTNTIINTDSDTNAQGSALRAIEWLRYYIEGFSSIGRALTDYSIFPQNAGSSAIPTLKSIYLGRNDADIITLPTFSPNLDPSNIALYNDSIYMSTGITNFKIWTDEFFRVFEEERASLGLPIPTKLTFDYEQTPELFKSLSFQQLSSMTSPGQIGWWPPTSTDARKNTELVDGTNTLQSLIGSAKDITNTSDPTSTLDTNKSITDPANFSFAQWMTGLIVKSVDNALAKSVYASAKNKYPNIKTGNFSSDFIGTAQNKKDLTFVSGTTGQVGYISNALWAQAYNVPTLQADYSTLQIYPMKSVQFVNVGSIPSDWRSLYGITKSLWNTDYRQMYMNFSKTKMQHMRLTDPNKSIFVWIGPTNTGSGALSSAGGQNGNSFQGDYGLGGAPEYFNTLQDLLEITDYGTRLGISEWALWSGGVNSTQISEWNTIVETISSLYDALFNKTLTHEKDIKINVLDQNIPTNSGLNVQNIRNIKDNNTNLSFFIIAQNPKSTIWEFQHDEEQKPSLRITTTSKGATIKNLSIIKTSSINSINIQLDRQRNWRVRVKHNNTGFSPWSSLDLSGELRILGQRHTDNFKVKKTSKGVSVVSINPEFSFKKSGKKLIIESNSKSLRQKRGKSFKGS